MAELLPRYLGAMENHPFEIRIHIMAQGPEPDPKGNYKVNEGIECCPGGWVMMLADDTDQHPALFRRLGEEIEKHPDAGAFVFTQDRGPRWGDRWILHASPGNMQPGCVCGGQIIYRRALLGQKWRFEFDKYQERADGNMAQQLFAAHPEKFVFVPEMLTRFGSLEW